MTNFLNRRQILETIFKEFNDFKTVSDLNLKPEFKINSKIHFNITYQSLMDVFCKNTNIYTIYIADAPYKNHNDYRYFIDQYLPSYFKSEKDTTDHDRNLFIKMNPIVEMFHERKNITKEDLVLYCQNYKLIS